MAKKKEIAERLAPARSPDVLASKIYEIRLVMKTEKDEETALVKELKESLGDSTEVPGVCEFKTYDSVKTDWQTVAKCLETLVPPEVFGRAVASNSRPASLTKLLFSQGYQG